ncbi:transketolase [Georgenia subflava]|uniref:Transketolase n=1 Tax=Georgenia subflava TaxID=1622177 RepID=A0A6N7EPK2_9MICO|nr:transketolase [Georgenia subflava]MPV38797.1 transketolase [Georgenia subflava]
MNTRELVTEATLARLNVLRMIRAGKSGHLGGAFSCIDIVTALYFAVLRVEPSDPADPDRDRFLLSAGHKALSQYAVLARRGFFPEEWLDTYGSVSTKLPGHPDMHKLPGVEANTGALGHGLAIAAGMALGLRAAGNGGRVFTILGDGELPEGSNWEGASIASHHKLGNLVAFIDVNDLQISGRTADVMNMEPIADKFRAFGWRTTTIDGNDIDSILGSVRYASSDPSAPTAVVARTTKAKGISFLEGTLASHYWKPSADELRAAESELRAASGLLVGKE